MNDIKELLLEYKIYFQTLINIRDGNEVLGDKETLEILEKRLEKRREDVKD